MRGRSFSASCALVALLAVAPTQASDGALEINQACAAGPGCFAGDAGALPVTITAAGSYRLTSNLVVADANTDAVLISASDVLLDLGGFRILGPNTCSGTPTTCTLPSGTGDGVDVTSTSTVTGVEVARGSVVGMGQSGIRLGTESAVREVRASQNRANGLDLGFGSTVSASATFRNGKTGMNILSGGSVSGSTASENGGSGITVANGSSVSGSSASGNGGDGITAMGGSALAGSSATDNVDDGFALGTGVSISNCAGSGNGGDGIQASLGSLVTGSSVDFNAGAGLRLADDAAYRENVITRNTVGTVVILGSGAFVNLGDNFCTDGAGTTVPCP